MNIPDPNTHDIESAIEEFLAAEFFNDLEMDCPNVEIIEQPAPKALRFRYECEGRSAGSLPGINSTEGNKTFPKIKINNYVGDVWVIVSCVTKDDFRVHPHNIVGRENCQDGFFKKKFENNVDTVIEFPNLGIQCVKKKDAAESIRLRSEKGIDPFKKGYEHMNNSNSIDLNALRLCFQVYVPSDVPTHMKILAPVASEPIYDKKALSDLNISRIIPCSASAVLSEDIVILCEKVSKDDIKVRFFNEENGWEGYGESLAVHHQYAISFKTPIYNQAMNGSKKVSVQLFRPSDMATSEARLFTFKPDLAPRRKVPKQNPMPTLKVEHGEPNTSMIYQNPNNILPTFVQSFSDTSYLQRVEDNPYQVQMNQAQYANTNFNAGSPTSFFSLLEIQTNSHNFQKSESCAMQLNHSHSPNLQTTTGQNTPNCFTDHQNCSPNVQTAASISSLGVYANPTDSQHQWTSDDLSQFIISPEEELNRIPTEDLSPMIPTDELNQLNIK